MRIGDFGQPRLEALLDEMLERGRVGGSFLFEGPLGTGKEALAVELGRLLNCDNGGRCPAKPPFTRTATGAAKSKAAAQARCGSCHKFDILQHPDLLLVFPVPKDTWDEAIPRGRGDEQRLNTLGEILRDKARNPYYRKQDFERPSNIEAEVVRERVLPKVYSRPVEGRCKTIVISDVEQMAHDMGNLLLKTLEEPPDNVLLVVTSAVPMRLLPTILSRCQRLRFTPLVPEWMEPRLTALLDAKPQPARLAAAVSQGSMLAAERFLEGDLEKVRDLAFDTLQGAATGQDVELLDIAAMLAAEHTKKRHQIPVFLQMLAAAARDALLAGTGVGDAAARGKAIAGPRFVNADRATDLHKLAKAFDTRALHAMIRKAEATERQIAGNAATEHALAAFFLGLLPQSAPAGAAAGARTGGRR